MEPGTTRRRSGGALRSWLPRQLARIVAVACALSALLWLTGAAAALPFAPSALPVARAHPGDVAPLSTPSVAPSPTLSLTPTATPSPTPTGSPSPTPDPPPPTLALVSPSSAQGPVGAHLTIQGSNWGAGTVTVGAATSAAECASSGSWRVTFGTTSSGASGTIRFTSVWPTSLATPGVTYRICAQSSAGSANAGYEVLSSLPPTLALSAASARVGQSVAITGTSFYGVPRVTLVLSSARGAHLLTSLVPYADGTFTYRFVVSPGDVGTATITATSPAEGSAPPAIQASAVIVVVAAGTPVPTITPTSAPITSTLPGNSTPPSLQAASGPSVRLVLLLATLLGGVLVLLVALLVLLLRRGQPGGPVPAYLAPAGIDRRLAEGFTTSGLPGASSRMPARDIPGAAAAWEDGPEEDAGPGPDWHPRPMGGTHARIPAVGPDDEPSPYPDTEAWSGEPTWYDASPDESGYSYEPPAQTTPEEPSPRDTSERDLTRADQPAEVLDDPPADESPADESPADAGTSPPPFPSDEAKGESDQPGGA